MPLFYGKARHNGKIAETILVLHTMCTFKSFHPPSIHFLIISRQSCYLTQRMLGACGIIQQLLVQKRSTGYGYKPISIGTIIPFDCFSDTKVVLHDHGTYSFQAHRRTKATRGFQQQHTTLRIRTKSPPVSIPRFLGDGVTWFATQRISSV